MSAGEVHVAEANDRLAGEVDGADGAPVAADVRGAGPMGGAAGARLSALRPFVMLGLAGALLTSGIVAAFLRAPKADAAAPLRDAKRLIEGAKYADAVDVLNERMAPLVDAQVATPAQRLEMLRLRAHALHEAQQVRGDALEANFRMVIEDYSAVLEEGGTLAPHESFELGWSQMSVGELSAAAARAKSIPDTDRELRHRLVRAIVERDLGGGKGGGGGASLSLELLTDLLAEPSLSEEQRAWAVARQAELQLADGHADEAITRLLREVQRTREAPASQRADLHILLGRAYAQVSDRTKAREQFEFAEELLSPSDPRRAEVGVHIGRVFEAMGGEENRERARERYAAVVSESARSPAYLKALFGLGRVYAAESKDREALEALTRVVDELLHPGVDPHPEVTPALVRRALMQAFDDRTQDGASRGPGRGVVENYRTGLKYASLAESLDPPGKAPAVVLRAIASAKKRLALELLDAELKGRRGIDWLRDLSPVTRDEVKRLLLSAGAYYREHSRSVSEPTEYAMSLWEAADAFDLGGDPESARKAFADYIDGTTDADPRRSEARFRLAQVLQSIHQYASAADIYSDLVAAGPGALGSAGWGGGGAGGTAWSARSLVPLAQCLLRDSEPANDGEAERLLLLAVNGTALGPEAQEFRRGLVQLGRLYYERKRYEDAIARLAEAIERFPDDPAIDSLRYELADSYRQSAAEIEAELQAEMIDSEKRQKEATRVERLRRAIETFEIVRRSVEAQDQSRLSELQKVQLRNTMFYLGDCAYDLGDYAAAINHYDAARQRYPNEPAALVAMVQIVNAYVKQGEWAKARTANESARRHLAKLPPEAWSSPDMPMERKHWERWLNSTTLLEQRAQADSDR